MNKPFKEFRYSISTRGELRLRELHGRSREVKGDKILHRQRKRDFSILEKVVAQRRWSHREIRLYSIIVTRITMATTTHWSRTYLIFRIIISSTSSFQHCNCFIKYRLSENIPLILYGK